MLAWIGALALAASQGAALVNGDFEEAAAKDGSIAGWTVAVGAQNGGTEPSSEVVCDSKVKHGGKQSLRFTGDSHTRVWQIASQEVDVLPGATCKVRGFAKAENIRPERVEGEIPQFMNAYLALFLLDRGGEVVGKEVRPVRRPTSDWTEIAFEIAAPDAARRARVTLFLSMSGSLWIDDVTLEMSGGRETAKPTVVFTEGFEQATAVPPEWKEEEGAMNGARSPRSRIVIDPSVGAPGSPRSLALVGDTKTRLWFALRRSFPAAPGELVRFRAQVRANDVHPEGIQFPNFHMHVFFKDKNGKDLEPVRFVHPGTDSFEWKESSVENTAPDGAAEAVVGVFLSMSGHVWLDKIEVTKEAGAPKPYADWTSLDSKHFTLRFQADPSDAGRMTDYGKRLDQAFEQICKRVGVKYDEKITAFLYRDGEQGQRITGRELDFADPEGRAFHQTLQSTISHEMTHVIFRNVGYAQTGLLGEGVAVYLNGAPADAHHARAAKLLAEGKLPSLAALLSGFRDEREGYPAAGSFCGFVIEKYGMDRFKKLYLEKDPAGASKRILGVPLSDVEAKWHEALAAKGKTGK